MSLALLSRPSPLLVETSPSSFSNFFEIEERAQQFHRKISSECELPGTEMLELTL